MRKLYLRIYLAVIASIVVSVALAGLAWRVVAERESFIPRQQFFQALAERMLPPPDATPAQQRESLERWRQLSGFDLALVAPDGRLIASTGPEIWDETSRSELRRGAFGRRSITMVDGRQIFAQPPPSMRGPFRGLSWLLALFGIAIIVALCAWPVVRRLTRDLEKLEAGVASFGAGQLSARVNVKSRDEIGRLSATFNQTAERIETLVRANRALLANASHELRSPLARLRMSVENVGADTPQAVRDEIARNIRELDALVEEILTSSRLEARPDGSLKVEPLDLRPLAAEECARAGAEFHAGPGSQVEVRGDARLLQRLMRNLLENANRYANGSRVEASLYSADGEMYFDVCDRGPGVEPSERERIFEPFYRPSGASERSGGVGLGLALVRQIARAHGGDATCLPRDGGGACFRVRLTAVV
jgi:signal transduction histidine kinase